MQAVHSPHRPGPAFVPSGRPAPAFACSGQRTSASGAPERSPAACPLPAPHQMPAHLEPERTTQPDRTSTLADRHDAPAAPLRSRAGLPVAPAHGRAGAVLCSWPVPPVPARVGRGGCADPATASIWPSPEPAPGCAACPSGACPRPLAVRRPAVPHGGPVHRAVSGCMPPAGTRCVFRPRAGTRPAVPPAARSCSLAWGRPPAAPAPWVGGRIGHALGPAVLGPGLPPYSPRLRASAPPRRTLAVLRPRGAVRRRARRLPAAIRPP